MDRETNAALPDAAVLDALGRRALGAWRLLLACMLVGAVAGGGVSAAQPKVYTASSSLLLDDGSVFEQALLDSGVGASVDAQRLTQTTADIIGLPVVAAGAAAKLGGSFTRKSVQEHVTTQVNSGSDILEISATNGKAAVAADLANAVAAQYGVVRATDTKARVDALVTVLDGQRAQAATAADKDALTQRIDRLQSAGAIAAGTARVIQPAIVPDSPSSPRPARNAALGAILALLLGLGVALLRARRDEG